MSSNELLVAEELERIKRIPVGPERRAAIEAFQARQRGELTAPQHVPFEGMPKTQAVLRKFGLLK